MADLYTSLVRAKQELNGGVLPAMTPVPDNVQQLIDPAYTIGLGALYEDPAKGLRCPVRNCGVFSHNLTNHLNMAHRNVGGARAVRAALSLPASVGLTSRWLKEQSRQTMLRAHAAGKIPRPPKTGSHEGNRGKPRRRFTVMEQNLTNTCQKQSGDRLIALQEKLGRVPTSKEARALDAGLDSAAIMLYGSWNAFVTAVGLRAREPHKGRALERDAVIESLKAWHYAHGELPTVLDSKAPTRTPLIPSAKAIMRALQATSWRDAMEKAAAMLNIYGGRYGLPEKARPKKEMAA